MWLFIYIGGVWTQPIGGLVCDSTTHQNHGLSVALSADGHTALAGGYDGNSGQGEACVWRVGPGADMMGSLAGPIFEHGVRLRGRAVGDGNIAALEHFWRIRMPERHTCTSGTLPP